MFSFMLKSFYESSIVFFFLVGKKNAKWVEKYAEVTMWLKLKAVILYLTCVTNIDLLCILFLQSQSDNVLSFSSSSSNDAVCWIL